MIVVLGIGGTHLSGFQMSVINYASPVGKTGEKKIPSLTVPHGLRPYTLQMLYKSSHVLLCPFSPSCFQCHTVTVEVCMTARSCALKTTSHRILWKQHIDITPESLCHGEKKENQK